MDEYVKYRSFVKTPRLPLDGSLDLTYRCNNNCRHCWLWIPPESPMALKELTIDEIKAIVEEARRMGCQKWSISGGEPMLRPDFVEIFDYITNRSVYYSLNTNGTLITPEIAELMKRKGRKMVALYGATPEIHDHITRNPGSFQATMEGISYLNDAGARFTVQLIPMKDNYHQFQNMIHLAKSLSQELRVGASWLYLSANGSQQKNAEIAAQRLSPHEVIIVDKPDIPCEERIRSEYSSQADPSDNRLFARCIHHRRAFHIDPYGQMTFCCFIKDPNLRYDLRKGSFQDAWEEFIPSLADKIRGGSEFVENCGSCDFRAYCRWCPVYAYLEHGRYGARIDYLCEIAKENRAYSDAWKRNHRRYYRIAGITVKVESDLPISDDTFDFKFRQFQVDSADGDMISIMHHFTLPDLKGEDLGEEIYRKAPWAIYRKGRSWIYVGIPPNPEDPNLYTVGIFSEDHTHAQIFNNRSDIFLKGGLSSLTLFTSDQILLARVLADRKACILHSAGMIFDGKGILFLGHSEAGKSTTVKMLKSRGEILCDDRNIVRRWPEGFRVHGTWSHGEVPLVSPASAPLNAILFLRKSEKNRLTLIDDRKMIIHRLMGCLVRPFVTVDWWHKMISLLEEITHSTPCYQMEFDKSGEIIQELQILLEKCQDEKFGR